MTPIQQINPVSPFSGATSAWTLRTWEEEIARVEAAMRTEEAAERARLSDERFGPLVQVEDV